MNGTNFYDCFNSFHQGSLTVSDSCSIAVTFTPSAVGSRTATLTFNDAASSPQNVTLTGTGQTAVETLTATTPGLFLGGQEVGNASSPFYAIVTNSGTATVNISSISLAGPNGGDFAITPFTYDFNGYNYIYPCAAEYSNSLRPDTTCAVQLTFTPSATGDRVATLTFTSDAPNSPLSIPINGYGVTGGLNAFPTALAFSQPNGVASAPQIVTVANTGNASITVSSDAITGPADYAITSDNCNGNTLTSGSTCTIKLVYTPSAVGSTSASLGIVTAGGNLAVSLKGSGQNPTETLSVPASINFASQGTSIASLPQAITIQNTGTAPVSLTNFTIGGANAGDFSIAANTCGATLAQATSCVVAVTFTPTATGARTAELTITDDATGSPQSVTLNGTGSSTQNTLTLSPLTQDFGFNNAGVASAQNPIQVYNSGTANVNVSAYSIAGTNAADFTVTENDCAAALANVIPSNNACYVYVTFKPSAAGSRTATLQITDNASGSPQIVQLAGIGQLTTQTLTLSPASLSLGTSNVGTATNGTSIYITNTGDTSLTLNSYTIAGTNAADFSISFNGCTSVYANVLAPQGYCGITVVFTPSASGIRTATLKIADSATGSPQSIPLEGTGQAVTTTLSLSPTTIAFGISNVGVGANGSTTATNTGNANVTFTNYAISGANAADFAINYNYCTNGYSNVLAPQGSCYVVVTFTPSAAGARTATLTLTDNATGGSQSIALTGTGQTAAKTVSYSGPIDFGVQSVGGTRQSTAYIYNTGTANFSLASYAISGANAADFAINYNVCNGSFYNPLQSP